MGSPRVSVTAALLLLGTTSLWSAGETPTAEEILTRTAAAYKGLTSYRFQVTTTTQVLSDGAMQQLMETNITLTGSMPDKARLELQSARNRLMIVRSGNQVLAAPASYTPVQLQELLFAGVTEEGPSTGFPPLDRAVALLSTRFLGIAKNAKAARVVREETLDLTDGRRRCWVVQFGEPPSPTADAPETYWVDEQRYVVLRSVNVEISKEGDATREIKSIVTYRSSQVNQLLDSGLFAMAAPVKGRSGKGTSGSAPGGYEAVRKGPPPKAKVVSVTKVKKADVTGTQ